MEPAILIGTYLGVGAVICGVGSYRGITEETYRGAALLWPAVVPFALLVAACALLFAPAFLAEQLGRWLATRSPPTTQEPDNG